MYKNKINKILFGVLIFMFAAVNVFAKCSDPQYQGNQGLVSCQNATEDGFKCGISSTRQCYRTSDCATGYKKSGNSCVKESNNSRKQYYYSCNGSCLQLYNYEKEQKGSACKDTQYATKTKCEEANANNSRKQYYYNCGGKCLQLYNYEKEQKGSACKDTQYATKTKCEATLPAKQPDNPVKITTYSISFNPNGGTGLICDVGWAQNSGICKKTGITSGTTVNVPSSSSQMTGPDGSLIGWTKTSCDQGKIVTDSVKVTSNSDYKACYRENIGGYRYLEEGFLVEGQTSPYKCGDSIYIEYCTKENNVDYCYYYNHDNATYVKIYRDKIVENSEAGKQNALASCSKSTTTTPTDEKNINDYRYALTNSKDYVCGEALFITTCTNNICNYNRVSRFTTGTEVAVNGTVNYSDITDSTDVASKTCKKLNVDEDDKECTNEIVRDNVGTDRYTVCFEKNASRNAIKDIIKENYRCAKGYELDETSIYSNSRESCNNKICSMTYEVTCVRSEGKYKPTLEVTSGNIGSDGKTGNITVHAKSKEGKIMQYYASPIYKTPTATNTDWINVNSDTFTITETPGVYYIWVKDSKGNISSGIGGAVFDTVNADTTINDFGIYNSNGELLPPTGNTAYKVKGITNSSYVKLSNNLVNDSIIADNGFNPYTMEYKVEVDTPTISVYATLTSTDSSYVNGYEPRTVNLDYGMNTVLIKIQNKEGKVRTYTILVNRVDDRKADNTLSDLSIDVGNINFNSNKTEYKIEIPNNTERVNVNATIGNEKATFVEGYKPGVVNITGDTTVNFIKVKSETGSTRTYVLTFIKEGTDIIKKKNLMLFDLVIPGVYVAFEEEIVNYNISVAYETELINLNYDLKDEDSSATIYYKGKNDNEYKVSSNEGIKLDVGENFVEIKIVNIDGEESYYRLTIIRKEFGLGISDDTTLRDLNVLGYEIDYEPNNKEYTVRIKQEKSLVITAIPNNDRAEVFIRGNDELTGFSTVRVKVVAENGEFDTYSIDIKKDAFNKTIEIAAIIAGVVIILGSSCIIVIKNKNKKKKEYYEE